MARRVFFSFHYQRDISRVSRIRNSWVTRDRETAGFWDAASWEQVKSQGENTIKRWIDNQLENTSVTVVLIGAETAGRKYVNYEIQQSHNRGNALLGITVHNMKNLQGYDDVPGPNPFKDFYIMQNGQQIYLSQLYPVYDWVNNDGYNNIAQWIEDAAFQKGK